MFPFLLLPVELQQLILGYKGQYYPKTMEMAKFAFADTPEQFSFWLKQVLIRDDIEAMDILQYIGYHYIKKDVTTVFIMCASHDSIECYKVLSKNFYIKEFSTVFFEACIENNSIQIWSYIIPFFNKTELLGAVTACVGSQKISLLQICVDNCDKTILNTIRWSNIYNNLPAFKILYPHLKNIVYDLIESNNMECIAYVLEQQPHLIKDLLLNLFNYHLKDRFELIDDLLPYLRPEDINDIRYFSNFLSWLRDFNRLGQVLDLIDRLIQLGVPLCEDSINLSLRAGGNREILDKLLSLGANRQCLRALNTAIQNKSIELIKYLVDAGFSFGDDAILAAIKTLNTDIIRLVLQLGAPKNPKALILVCNMNKNMQLPILKLLVQSGYDMPGFILYLQTSDNDTGMQNYLKCSRLWSKF